MFILTPLLTLLSVSSNFLNWEKVSIAPSNAELTFEVLLKQDNVGVLEYELNRRANPVSKYYGQWLSKNKIDDILYRDPSPELLLWLDDPNLSCSYDVDNVICTSTIKFLNNFFNTEIDTYRHIETNKYVFSGIDKGFHIPLYLYNEIEVILGIADFPDSVFKKHPTPSKLTDDSYIISPESIRSLYNMSNSYNNSNVSSQSVAEFINDNCFNLDDLNTFLKDNNKAPVNISTKNFWATCDMNTDSPDIEASLDIQYQTGVNYDSELYYVSVSEWLYQFANELYLSNDPPKVVSISYGWAEWDQCDPSVFPNCNITGNSQSYAKRTNTEFMKLSLRGISILASSGDAGAPGRTSEQCDPQKPLNPAFPASSPWVTAVGGTIIENATNITHPITPLCKKNTCIGDGVELNCNIDRCQWTAGGGFSNFFTRPWWQTKSAKKYLNSSVVFPPNKFFNSSGRIYPDISLVSHNFIIRTNGEYGTVDGTSASSPSVSGMVSILNNNRVSNGKPTLGPLGPLLYHIYENCADCFKDILIGSNNSTEESECKWGYTATKGFDAVYGLGTPNFNKIYDFVNNLEF